MQELTDLFNIQGRNTPPAQGKVLISEPFLQDGMFRRSIVLLTEYSKEGAIGFVLNKPLDVAIHELVAGFPVCDASVSLGGPVNTDRLHYLHRVPDIPDAIRVMDGLWWGGTLDIIRQGIAGGSILDKDIRFFMGYSGWSPGQLDEELSRNAWVVWEWGASEVLTLSEGAWKQAVQNLGEQYRSWNIVPENPLWN